MKNYLAGMAAEGQMLEIAYVTGDGQMHLFGGRLVSIDDNCTALRLANGAVRVLRTPSISYIDIIDSVITPAATPADETSGPDASAESGDTPATPDVTTQTETYDRSDIFSNTPVLSAPKVLGRIDLDSIGGCSRYRRTPYEVDSDDTPRAGEFAEEMLPGMGYVARLGANYGFIQPNDPGAQSMYVARKDLISIHGIIKAPDVGDQVIYTPSTNRQGEVARCVHRVCSVNTLAEMAQRLGAYDQHTAAILRARLRAVEQGTPLAEAMPPRQPVRQRPVQLDPDEVMAMIEKGEELEPRSITSCEEAYARHLTYDDYMAALDRLIEYATAREMTAAHRLFSRGIRVARDNNDTDTAARIARRAMDYYTGQPGNYNFFRNIEARMSNPAPQPEPSIADAADNNADSNRPAASTSSLGDLTSVDPDALRASIEADDDVPAAGNDAPATDETNLTSDTITI